ncbi:MAG TPA: putative sugar nucleotidyl transferase, partial [Bacteroidia bacterium]
MMNYVLFDDSAWSDLLPLTFTRPACEIRIGILTIKEKWELLFKKDFSYRTQNYLSAKFPFKIKEKYPTLFVNGRVCPDATLFSEIKKLKMFQVLFLGNIPLAYCGDADSDEFHMNFSKIYSKSNPTIIQYPWDIFRKNENQLIFDFILLTSNRKSKTLSKSNLVIGKGKVFVESGASVECTAINPLGGFVYIGKDAVVMEGCHIRGSF